jgi:hypothetical protein
MSRVGVPTGEVDGGTSGERPAPTPTTDPVGVLSTDALPALAAGDGSGVLLAPAGCVFMFWFCVSDGERAGALDARGSTRPASPPAIADAGSCDDGAAQHARESRSEASGCQDRTD